MRTFKKLAVLTALGLSVVSGAAFAASPERFMSGQSMNGQPADGVTNSRTVDVATAKSVKVAYGESLGFVNAGKSFSWQFNGLDNRRVDLGHIAPSDFSAKNLNIYVGKNPSNRN